LFPYFIRIAFDYYSIPIITNDYEYSFSSTKLTVNSQQYSLSSKTINVIENLKF
ncbi:hypothetical protein B0T20DRAFT_359883, partial [Sordaria brevicollis]